MPPPTSKDWEKIHVDGLSTSCNRNSFQWWKWNWFTKVWPMPIQSEVPIYIVIMKSSSVVVSKQMLVSSILIFYIELFLILRIVVVVYWPEFY